jgi:hypothetical protein
MQYFIEQVNANGVTVARYMDIVSYPDAIVFFNSMGFTPITDGEGYRIVDENGADVTPEWWTE